MSDERLKDMKYFLRNENLITRQTINFVKES
jgi:hypothetical protein